MFFKYLKTTSVLILLIIFTNLFKNYIRIYDNDLSILQNASLLFEATNETKSEILSILDFIHISKTEKYPDLKKLYLDIELSSLEKSKVNINQVLKKKKYFNAKIKFDEKGDLLKIKFRMRGKNHWHHRLDKPSLRLKLKKQSPYKMMRHINLISPEGRTVIENYYPDKIAKKIGLTGHYGELIELIINNKSYGIYHLISREDESMIRLNNKMPGPILIGKYLNEKWEIDNFEIININSINHNKDIFKKMITTLNTKKDSINWSTYKNFWEIVNFEQTAKFISLNNILGILHNDYFHNQEFYFDPTKGRIEPIISDAMSLGTMIYPWGKRRYSLNTITTSEKPNFKTSLNQKTNPLLNIVLVDPEFYSERISVLYRLIKGELSYENQKKYLQKIYKEIDKTVYRDKKKSHINFRIGGWNYNRYSNIEYEIYKKNVFFYLDNRIKYLKKEINKNNLILQRLTLKEYPDKKFIRIKYKGHGGIIFDKKNSKKLNIIIPKNGKLKKINSSKLKLYSGLKIKKNDNYQTNMKRGSDIFHTNHYMPDYQSYIIQLDKNNFRNKDIEKFFNDILNNKLIKNIEWEDDTFSEISRLNYNNHSLHIWNKIKLNNKKKIILGPGVIELKENLKINKDQILYVLPGTTILMYPEISIHSKGKVIIDGTKKKITIKSKYVDSPWGNISINSKNSNGSILKNLSVSGGSVSNIENVRYSGMISFFWNEGILLEDLIVSDNKKGDDTIHFSNSKGIIKNLKILNCFGDCIDFDYSQYNLSNLNIVNSINDGLDFMESTIYGKNIKIKNSGDKAISAGEKSTIKIKGITIDNSLIGIAVKDLSRVDLNNVYFTNNSVAIDIYRKNWRYYKEGEIFMQNFHFTQNALDILTTDLSALKFDTKGLIVKNK